MKLNGGIVNQSEEFPSRRTITSSPLLVFFPLRICMVDGGKPVIEYVGTTATLLNDIKTHDSNNNSLKAFRRTYV